MLKTKLVSSMEKCFLDSDIAQFPVYNACIALRDMQTSFQLFTQETLNRGVDKRLAELRYSGDLVPYMTVRSVEYVPSNMPVYSGTFDDNFLRTTPGLYPDLLQEVHYNGRLRIQSGQTRALWFDIMIPEDADIAEGEHALTIEIVYGEEILAAETFTVELVDTTLPEQDFPLTQWFHCDCLASYYNVPMFSERHWEIIENFMRVAVKNGISMILTPVFTPPLDTHVGGERPTAQLVDVTVTEDGYAFGYEKLDRWIDLCDRVGVKYFEISHLFTQWGAEHAPKIVGTKNGEAVRLFGWETDATGDDYIAFLNAFLPDFLAHMKARGDDKRCYYHVSDEPHPDHLDNYAKAKAVISTYLKDYVLMDALGNYAFYESGLVETPVVATNKIETFLENKVPTLWAYYCCGQWRGVSNRFFSMPGWRTRYIGIQMYYHDIKGFLQWGYNFYYNRGSYDLINPYLETAGEYFAPSGDTFSVYPAADGTALESMRIVQFREGLDDMRLCRLCEARFGREAVIKEIEAIFGKVVFSECPYSAKPILKLRERLLTLLKSAE